jgi:hypothetical protein
MQTTLLDFCMQSASVTDSASNTQWYNHTTKFKKMLQMVIMRAQHPSIILAGFFNPITMEHFKNVSQISLHVFVQN